MHYKRKQEKRTIIRIELQSFRSDFKALTGDEPFRWQQRLFLRIAKGDFPLAVDIPTALSRGLIEAGALALEVEFIRWPVLRGVEPRPH